MSKKVVTISQIKEIVNQIRNHHHASYNKIADLNKSFDFDGKEWPVNEVLNTFNDSLEIFEKKSELLNGKINRKETKIFVFGNVSVGKSKVINSLLKLDLFVSASSHTTSCFVHIMKSQDSKYVIKYRNKEETFKDISDLKERIKTLGTAHDIENKEKLDVDDSIEFYLPIKNNKILKEGTHIIDCPGAGNQVLITKAIEKHSEDADIFIFVMSNALTDADKQFFKYQSKLSCKPDVFILVNRWDDTDQDDETATQNSKISIIKQCSNFLIDECDMDCSEIEERTFFISAKEIFQLQVTCDKEIKITDKMKQRCKSFERFLMKLEKYIDNNQQNKYRRYQKEINQVNKDINHKCAECKLLILKLRLSSANLNHENLTKSVKELKKTMKKAFEDFKSEFKKQIDSGIDEIANHKDVLNEDAVQDKISLLNKELEEKMRSFSKDQEKKIVKYLKDNLTKSDEMKNNIKMKKPYKAYETVDTNVNTSNEREEERRIFETIARSLAVGNITTTGAIFAFGAAAGSFLLEGAACLLNEYFYSKSIKENARTKLAKINNNIFKNCETEIDNMKKHYNKTIKSFADFITKQKKFTDDYWNEMKDILAPWQYLDKN